jgi:hypothetical protein
MNAGDWKTSRQGPMSALLAANLEGFGCCHFTDAAADP